MSFFGPPDINKLKAKGDVQGLINALSYQKDAKIRETAADALGPIGDPRAVEPLIAALKDDSASVGKAAAKALGEMREVRAVDPLFSLLMARARSGDKELSLTVEGALVAIGMPAMETLVVMLKRAQPGHYNAESDCAARALMRLGTPGVEPLLAALNDKNVSAMKALSDSDSVSIEYRRAIAPLMVALTVFGRETKENALLALKKIDPEWPNSDEARSGISLLGELIKKETRRSGYEPHESETEQRRQAIRVLAAIQAPLIEPLISALACWADYVSNEAEEVLDRHYPDWPKSEAAVQAIPSLIAAFGPEASTQKRTAINFSGVKAKDALVKIGAPAVDPLIVAMKGNPDPRVREEAAKTLGEIGDTRATEALNAALADSDEKVRIWAGISLKKIPKSPE